MTPRPSFTVTIEAADGATELDCRVHAEPPDRPGNGGWQFEIEPDWGKQRCVNCAHLARCFMLMGRTGDETECDWTPSRYQAAPLTVAEHDAALAAARGWKP